MCKHDEKKKSVGCQSCAFFILGTSTRSSSCANYQQLVIHYSNQFDRRFASIREHIVSTEASPRGNEYPKIFEFDEVRFKREVSDISGGEASLLKSRWPQPSLT